MYGYLKRRHKPFKHYKVAQGFAVSFADSVNPDQTGRMQLILVLDSFHRDSENYNDGAQLAATGRLLSISYCRL
ncbi:hypothetical protein DPMN_055552 [Dreissena polymorpha]|uniref:Uncharacterized protein n=1 Tax=Dreissena polymorpha TaxID=45954 RepID=A0A9D4HST0_DREPO|nr:hypothetical protein DPMN_055552 [Dreissena polymorpha]